MNQFIFYKSFYEAILYLPKEVRGEVYEMICQYCFEGKEPEGDGMAKAMFTMMKANIDSANKRYLASIENGKKGGAPKGNQNAKKQPKNNLELTQKQPKNNHNNNINNNNNKNNNNNINNNIKDNRVVGEEENKNEKHCYGEFKRIKLTDKEYNKLINDYGEELIKEKIQQLDEYIQMNNNKNKYKDFNLVLRKAIRENWFINKNKNNNYGETKLRQDGKNCFIIGG
jgi:hypothetical protein